MSTLEIKLFGTLSLERAGQPLPHFPSRQVKDLLAYLLLNRHSPHAREHLAGMFWSECDGDRARHCLNTALWRLQRVLGPPPEGGRTYLRVDTQHIGFNTSSDFRLDVADFENRCAWAERVESPDQQALLYKQAIACYRADLLVDNYEDWCLVERERLHTLYLRALGRLLAYHAGRRDFDAAAEMGRRILACDPLREEVHRSLIKVYLAAGQPAAAMRQYRACEEVVRRELGTELMPETQALLKRIVGTLAAPAPPAPALGPGRPAPDLAALLSQLQEAVDGFDRARSQLGEASTVVREAIQRLGRAIGGQAGDTALPVPEQRHDVEPPWIAVTGEREPLCAAANS